VKNAKFLIKSTKRGLKMNVYDKTSDKITKKEEYLAGRITVAEYSKWLNDNRIAEKLINSAKKSQINPNLAFRKMKGKETSFRTYGEMLEARKKIEDAKKKVVIPEGKYAWMEHAQEPDEDVPF
jgi:SOS response regulatory protein OraA/RecX